MADELTITTSLTFRPNTSKNVLFSKQGSFDVTGSKHHWTEQTIGTSEEALGLGDLATVGWFVCYNHDDENFVTIRAGSGAADLVKVPPGGLAGPFYLASATPYAIADTAACLLEYLVVEQ
jgi:hypothetical protein